MFDFFCTSVCPTKGHATIDNSWDSGNDLLFPCVVAWKLRNQYSNSTKKDGSQREPPGPFQYIVPGYEVPRQFGT
jgi:hypothetical protein